MKEGNFQHSFDAICAFSLLLFCLIKIHEATKIIKTYLQQWNPFVQGRNLLKLAEKDILFNSFLGQCIHPYQGEYSRNRIVINNSDYREANDKRMLSLIRKIRWLISFIIYIAHIGHQYFSVWIDPGPWLIKSSGGFICGIRRINWSFCNWLPTPPLSYSFALNE